MSFHAVLRRFFADELRVTYGLTSKRLVDAIAEVPRERFLPPGPWWIRGPHDQRPRQTETDDPAQICHDVAVAIDLERMLFNGQPSLIALWLESLQILEGDRVVHIGCGPGYFTAWMAEIVGAKGHVFAVDVDRDLAERARNNLSNYGWVEVQAGDGLTNLPSEADVILVHAGVTHLVDPWLDALKDGGRLMVPLTCTMPAMPPGTGKGITLSLKRQGPDWTARLAAPLVIYSFVGEARNDDMQARLGKALMAGTFMRVTRLRRDAHEPGANCWLHGPTWCLSFADGPVSLDPPPYPPL